MFRQCATYKRWQSKLLVDAVVRSWVLGSWRRLNHSNIRNAISSAGFPIISSSDILLSMMFMEMSLRGNSGEVEISAEDLELIPQDDELKHEKKVI